MTSVLILKKQWLDEIVVGNKRMELRGCASRKVGKTIYMMASKTDEITAKATIGDCIGPLTLEQFSTFKDMHKSQQTALPYKKTYGWILENVQPVVPPLPHKRKQGCIGFSVYHEVCESHATKPPPLESTAC